jgi:hypothetical protein
LVLAGSYDRAERVLGNFGVFDPALAARSGDDVAQAAIYQESYRKETYGNCHWHDVDRARDEHALANDAAEFVRIIYAAPASSAGDTEVGS